MALFVKDVDGYAQAAARTRAAHGVLPPDFPVIAADRSKISPSCRPRIEVRGELRPVPRSSRDLDPGNGSDHAHPSPEPLLHCELGPDLVPRTLCGLGVGVTTATEVSG